MKEGKKTIKERISELAEKYKVDNPMFSSDVMDIVERGAYPENFCPECQERMTFNALKGFFVCINCGYEEKQKEPIAETPPIISPVPAAGRTRVVNPHPMPDNMPAGVKKLIEDVPEAAKPIRSRTPGMADKITRLRNKMEGVATPADDEIIRNQDPNIKGEVNWV